MVDVCSGLVAKKMFHIGAYGFIHRFCSLDKQVEEFHIADKNAGYAIGLGDEGYNRFNELYNFGCRIYIRYCQWSTY